MNDKQFYEQAALCKISETTRRIEELRYRMLSSKVPKGSKKVLDIGCGNGELICMLAEKGHKCVALDLSKNRLAKFKSKAKKTWCDTDTRRFNEHSFTRFIDRHNHVL